MGFNFNSDDSDPTNGLDSNDSFVQPNIEMPVPGAPVEYMQQPVYDTPLVQEQSLQEIEENYEQVLSQVDRRMRVAHFYRSILDSTLFSEETSEARIVQSKIRKFCNDELEVIFGMRAPPQAVGQFTTEEVEFLKGLAAQVKLAKEAKVLHVTKPTVRQVQPKPAAVVQTIQSKPAVGLPHRAAPQKPTPQQTKPATSKMDLRIPEQHRDDPTAKIINGKVFVQARNDGGEHLWRTINPTNGEPIQNPVPIMRDVTPVAVPSGTMAQPIPMPSVAGGINSPFSQIMQEHANMTLRTLDRAASIPGVAGRVAQQLGSSLAMTLINKQGDIE